MLTRICVYCPEPHPLPARPGDELGHGISHGMCAKAYRRVNEELDRQEAVEIRRAQEKR